MYSELGITFVTGAATVPRASVSTSRETSSPPTSLVNDPDDVEGEVTSDDVPLTMTFATPQTGSVSSSGTAAPASRDA